MRKSRKTRAWDPNGREIPEEPARRSKAAELESGRPIREPPARDKAPRQQDPGEMRHRSRGEHHGEPIRETTCKHFQEQRQTDPGRTGKKAPGAHYCYINKNKKIQIKDTNKKIKY